MIRLRYSYYFINSVAYKDKKIISYLFISTRYFDILNLTDFYEKNK
jgi:hypothetical protein